MADTAIAEAELLAAIAADPRADEPRLVYADYLLDRGDQRGELIQVQCALARLADGEQWQRLKQREANLLGRNDKRWTRDLAPLAEQWSFHRGFVDEVDIRLERLVEDDLVAELRAVAPLFTSVRLVGEGFGDEGAAALRDCARVGALRALKLADNDISAAGSDALAAAPWMDRLQCFQMRGNQISLELARRLGGLWRMQLLVLEETGLDDACLRALGGGGMSWLGALHVGVNLLSGAALDESLRFPRLGALDVHRNPLGTVGIDRLAPNAILDGLIDLNLGHTSLGVAGMRALGRVPSFARLRSLCLAGCDLDDAAAATLAGAALDGLEYLDLSLNGGLGDEGARSLAVAARLSSLRVLELVGTSVGDDGVGALLDSPHLGRLSCLRLDESRLSPAGRDALHARFPDAA